MKTPKTESERMALVEQLEARVHAEARAREALLVQVEARVREALAPLRDTEEKIGLLEAIVADLDEGCQLCEQEAELEAGTFTPHEHTPYYEGGCVLNCEEIAEELYGR
jgi:hypothetical protein